MWFSFFWACALGIALLVLPGFLAACGFGFCANRAFGFAPVLSVCFYAVTAIVLPFVGIAASGWLLFVLALLFGALLAAGGFAVRRKRAGVACADAPATDSAARTDALAAGSAARTDASAASSAAMAEAPAVPDFWQALDRWFPLIACAVGIATVFAVFVPSLGTPENFVQNYDNAYHLSRAQSFLDSGNFSSLYVAFYPSAWHCLVAMLASAAGVSVTVAVNAATFAVAGVCYPLCMYALLDALFGGNGKRVFLGCIASTAIAFYPWRIVLFGPLYPNVLSFSLMPAVIAAFMKLVDALAAKRAFGAHLAVFLLGGIALALAQPNAIFSAGVFLIPFCLHRTWRFCRSRGKGAVVSFAAVFLLLLAFAALWFAVYKAPFMKGVVDYPREPALSVTEAVKRVFSFSFTLRRPQFVAGGLAVLGGACLLFERGRRWLPFSFAAAAIQFVVAISLGGTLRMLVAGFWYSDYYRLAATACVFAIPLIAVGLDVVLGVLGALVSHVAGRGNGAAVAKGVLSFAAVGVLFAFNSFVFGFVPDGLKATGFDAIKVELSGTFANDSWHSLGTEERAFLAKVAELTGNDVVANQPFDGSVFAHATSGVNVLCDQFNATQYGDSVTALMRGLARYTSDSAVAEALRTTGAKYLLQLDDWDFSEAMPENQEGSWADLGYGPADWEGINSIDENTPGFTLVLSEGDMRLYRIDGAE